MAATSTARRAAATRARKATAASDRKGRTASAASKAKPKRETSRTKSAPKVPSSAGAPSPASEAISETVVAKKVTGTRTRTTKARQAKPTTRPRSLVRRVYNTIDGELTKLEKQKGLTSQDRERASRALSQMVNALEKAVEMQREMTKTKSSGGDARSKEALAHAEDLRREIAERLERLNRKRATGRSSE
jgi:hypothetical protein